MNSNCKNCGLEYSICNCAECDNCNKEFGEYDLFECPDTKRLLCERCINHYN